MDSKELKAKEKLLNDKQYSYADLAFAIGTAVGELKMLLPPNFTATVIKHLKPGHTIKLTGESTAQEKDKLSRLKQKAAVKVTKLKKGQTKQKLS